jgi:RIO kinase 1
MRVPERLEPLLAHGVIEDVLRPLMSGKEAEVYLVLCGGEQRVAKVYKNSQFRSFQHRAEYTEGRRVRSSREQRAMGKRSSKHGREKTEEAWRSAEVDAIYRLREAGVRVPEPFAFADGVLVMELVKDASGEPAPRMVDLHFSPEEAEELFLLLVREVVKMLCAGLVHADLSDFNILMSAHGPVIIDFPQAIDPAANQSAKKLLLRDVENLSSFLGRFAPKLKSTQYGPEMWDLYERSELSPDTELSGRFKAREGTVEVRSLLDDILEVEREARERREALGLPPPRRARRPVIREEPPPPTPRAPRPAPSPRGQGQAPPKGQGQAPPKGAHPGAPTDPKPDGEGSGKRRRRRRRGGGGAPSESGAPAGPRPSPASPGPPPTQAPTESRPPRPGPEGGAGDGPKKRRRRRRRRGGGKPEGGGSSS